MDGKIFGMDPSEFVMVLILWLLQALPWILLVVLAILGIRWFLRKERERKDPERVAVRRSLGEVLKSHRERCKMTQELVAEKIGVSRQACPSGNPAPQSPARATSSRSRASTASTSPTFFAR